MAKRRYKSNCSKISVHLLVGGKKIIHEFKGKDTYTKERFTDVVDPEIQNALESASIFGVYYYKSSEFDWMEAEEKAAQESEVDSEEIDSEELPGTETEEAADDAQNDSHEDAEDAPDTDDSEVDESQNTEESQIKEMEFRTGNEAKIWLNETHGIPLGKLGNKTIVTEKALELGFKVSFLTDKI